MPGALSVSDLPPAGSPFVVGRPLRAQEPIFGRDAVLRALGDALAHGSSVNLVAMRRMGKTSLLRTPYSLLPPPSSLISYASRSPYTSCQMLSKRAASNTGLRSIRWQRTICCSVLPGLL